MHDRASLTRRGLLAGGAAATIATAAPVAAGSPEPCDNHDELMMLIDHRDEMIRQIEIYDRQMSAILDDPDAARAPEVDLCDFLGVDHVERYYPTVTGAVRFRGPAGIDHIDRFFNGKTISLSKRAAYNSNDKWALFVVTADWVQTKKHLHSLIEARRLYLAATGFTSLEESCNLASRELVAIERRAAALPCLSVRDIGAKLNHVMPWYSNPDNDNEEDLQAILNSIRDFANAYTRPAAASGQFVPGAS